MRKGRGFPKAADQEEVSGSAAEKVKGTVKAAAILLKLPPGVEGGSIDSVHGTLNSKSPHLKIKNILLIIKFLSIFLNIYIHKNSFYLQRQRQN